DTLSVVGQLIAVRVTPAGVVHGLGGAPSTVVAEGGEPRSILVGDAGERVREVGAARLSRFVVFILALVPVWIRDRGEIDEGGLRAVPVEENTPRGIRDPDDVRELVVAEGERAAERVGNAKEESFLQDRGRRVAVGIEHEIAVSARDAVRS